MIMLNEKRKNSNFLRANYGYSTKKYFISQRINGEMSR